MGACTREAGEGVSVYTCVCALSILVVAKASPFLNIHIFIPLASGLVYTL